MRLLNSKTLRLEEFYGTKRAKYAILSHTWGCEEVSFQEIQLLNANTDAHVRASIRSKPGYIKIESCCHQAAKDGYDWVWVDTCCIDKTSSAELSEAINSMFRWYEESEICYAFLEDVPAEVASQVAFTSAFVRSKWFTRGWTLQELLAPRRLQFYNRAWMMVGERSCLAHLVEEITRIPADFLGESRIDVSEASVAQRMSWAAKRETTRVEDMAYCLLGIFDVNMPLLYGEGIKAFRRLQEEIITHSSDESIFAWGLTLPGSSNGAFLASAPSDFIGSEDVVYDSFWKRNTSSVFDHSNSAIRTEMTCVIKLANSSTGGSSIIYFGILNCRMKNNYINHITIPLNRLSEYHPQTVNDIWDAEATHDIWDVERHRDYPINSWHRAQSGLEFVQEVRLATRGLTPRPATMSWDWAVSLEYPASMMLLKVIHTDACLNLDQGLDHALIWAKGDRHQLGSKIRAYLQYGLRTTKTEDDDAPLHTFLVMVEITRQRSNSRTAKACKWLFAEDTGQILGNLPSIEELDKMSWKRRVWVWGFRIRAIHAPVASRLYCPPPFLYDWAWRPKAVPCVSASSLTRYALVLSGTRFFESLCFEIRTFFLSLSLLPESRKHWPVFLVCFVLFAVHGTLAATFNMSDSYTNFVTLVLCTISALWLQMISVIGFLPVSKHHSFVILLYVFSFVGMLLFFLSVESWHLGKKPS